MFMLQIPLEVVDKVSNFVQGDKNIIKFDGDHNSSRPQFYYDSVSKFFYNVFRPPHLLSDYSSKAEKYYNLEGLKVSTGTNEVISAAIRLDFQNI